jgi:hypothetical protein
LPRGCLGVDQESCHDDSAKHFNAEVSKRVCDVEPDTHVKMMKSTKMTQSSHERKYPTPLRLTAGRGVVTGTLAD